MRSDNGIDLTGMAVLRFSKARQIEWRDITPSKPTQNTVIESFRARPHALGNLTLAESANCSISGPQRGRTLRHVCAPRPSASRAPSQYHGDFHHRWMRPPGLIPISNHQISRRADVRALYLEPCGFQSGLGFSGNTMRRRPAKFRKRPITVESILASGGSIPKATKPWVQPRSTTLTAITTAE